MLIRDSKWTLQGNKPVTKKSISRWVWLGSAGRGTSGQFWGGQREPGRWASRQEMDPNDHWAPKRDAVESGRRTYSRQGAV